MSQQVQGIIRNGADIISEKSMYGRNMYTSTFVPKLGMVLKGDHSNSYFGMPDADLYYAGLADAQMSVGRGDVSTMHLAAKQDPDSDYKRGYFGSVSKKVELEYSASTKKNLWMEAQVKKAKKSFIANGGNLAALQGMNPAIAAQLLGQKINPYAASVPPGGNDSAAQVVGPLTQIPFIQDVLGFPTPEYWINDLTTKVALHNSTQNSQKLTGEHQTYNSSQLNSLRTEDLTLIATSSLLREMSLHSSFQENTDTEQPLTHTTSMLDRQAMVLDKQEKLLHY